MDNKKIIRKLQKRITRYEQMKDEEAEILTTRYKNATVKEAKQKAKKWEKIRDKCWDSPDHMADGHSHIDAMCKAHYWTAAVKTIKKCRSRIKRYLRVIDDTMFILKREL